MYDLRFLQGLICLGHVNFGTDPLRKSRKNQYFFFINKARTLLVRVGWNKDEELTVMFHTPTYTHLPQSGILLEPSAILFDGPSRFSVAIFGGYRDLTSETSGRFSRLIQACDHLGHAFAPESYLEPWFAGADHRLNFGGVAFDLARALRGLK